MNSFRITIAFPFGQRTLFPYIKNGRITYPPERKIFHQKDYLRVGNILANQLIDPNWALLICLMQYIIRQEV